MASFAVLGGGISGLSLSYYLRKLIPHAKVTLFESAAAPGGWMSTKTDNDGHVFEQGPRSLRVSRFLQPTLDLCAEIGILDELIPSETGMRDISIYADGERIHIFPKGPFPRLKFLFQNGVHFRTFVSNIRRKKITVMEEDLPLSLFVRETMNFWKESDANYLINTYADAF
jgi:oxygen-dependent protoporphyrinogen oxidase